MIRFARLALAALALPVPAAAQMPVPGLQPTDVDSPVERLGRYLRVLSTAPRDLEALTGAGRAALDVGDANAAIGFFARAEEVSPRDGRVKAGLASALVQMEQPREALKLFDQAVSLGVPPASIAADRGLAFDLRGDNRRAQADYALALKAGRSDEVVRRLALSQAMAGDRAAALATLDPLLRRQDKAAWRASTFVLALTGDARGAVERVGLLVPAAQAQQIAPFLGRLASLKTGEQAQAVHFGHLPTAGAARPATALAAVTPMPRTGQALAPSGVALGSPAPRGGDVRPAPTTSPALAATVPPRVGAPPRLAAPLPAPGFRGVSDPVLADARGLSIPAPALAATQPARAAAPAVPAAQPGSPIAAAAARPGDSRPFATGPVRAVAPTWPAAQAVAPAIAAAARPIDTRPFATAPAQVASADRAMPPAMVQGAPSPAASPYAAPLAEAAPGSGTPGSGTMAAAMLPAAVAPTPVAASAPDATGPLGASQGTAAPVPSQVALADLPPSRADTVRVAERTDAAVSEPAERRAFPAGPAALPPRRIVRGSADVPAATRARAGTKLALATSPDRRARSDDPTTPDAKRTPGKAARDDDAAAPRKAGKARARDDEPAVAEAERTTGRSRRATGEASRRAGRRGQDETRLAALDAPAGKATRDKDDRAPAKGKSARDKLADAKGKTDPKKAKAEADAKAATAKAKKEPERHWVQVATGANKADLAKAWARVKTEHAATMAGKAAWTTPLRFTNRVLVGPFKSADEAQSFVNANAKAGFTTSRFTSTAGQAVERVGGK